jgi:hypothetical protein
MAAAHHTARKLAMLIAAFLIFVMPVFVLTYFRFRAPLANEAGEKQTTQPTTTQDAAGNQQAQ